MKSRELSLKGKLWTSHFTTLEPEFSSICFGMKYSSRKSYYISNRIENRKDNPI
jgi:hypothetical protein